MNALTLLYHDVVDDADLDGSGRPGPAAATFKLEVAQFRRHVAAIACATHVRPATALELLEGCHDKRPWLITFDDGGLSALHPVVDVLESAGWRGHFLVVTDCIGTSGYLHASHIRELHGRGHIIGSHSCSHPTRMSSCGWSTLMSEWGRSVEALSDILGETVSVASVPGGYYSHRVARAAARAGIRALFTSEPATRAGMVDGCLVLGRYSIRRGTPERVAGALAAGHRLPRLRQRAFWESKKLAKTLGGELYLKARRRLLVG